MAKCLICKEDFPVKDGGNVFCSEKCREIARGKARYFLGRVEEMEQRVEKSIAEEEMDMMWKEINFEWDRIYDAKREASMYRYGGY